MKKIFILFFLVLCVCFPVTANAEKYLNDDLNYPMTGGHGDYYEYTDLNSMQIIDETDSYYDLTVGYIIVSNKDLDNPYRVRTFRYWKDGVTRPQFYSRYLGSWQDIPSQNIDEVNNYRKNVDGSYVAYFKKFLPHMFNMLQLALRDLLGIEIYE